MNKLLLCALAAFLFLSTQESANAQAADGNLVHITKLKTVRPEGGNMMERDSLIAIYNNNVIKKNKFILSHREYAHYFTENSSDYLIIEEFKDFSSWEESVKTTEELEKAAWPDEAKFDAFMKEMNKYFENWHGDMLMHINPKLSKN